MNDRERFSIEGMLSNRNAPMNVYEQFSSDLLGAQKGLIEEFKRDHPKATQVEITAFAYGAIKMGSYAIKRYLAGESI